MPKTVKRHIGRVLLTRPIEKSIELSRLLTQHGVDTLSCPLIEVTPITDQQLTSKLDVSDIIIAVSTNAVTSASSQVSKWPKTAQYFAVGRATADALSQVHNEVITPNVHHTEGLLALTQLNSVVDKKVTILRGNGGRETLANELKLRGAQVEYSELYQRDIAKQCKNVVEQWQHQQITTIVVTSAEILQYLVTLINSHDKSWWADINVVVPSQRVAKIARQLDVPQLIVSQGADNQAILDEILNLQSSFYEK